MQTILTIGHSNHRLDRFVRLLKDAGVETVVDVRSVPASGFAPRFNRAALERSLPETGIGYRWMGDVLGGRPSDPSLFTGPIADYEKMAAVPAFRVGLGEVVAEAASRRVALMCSERDPENCHRCLLVGRQLAAEGHPVGHVHADGRIEDHAAFEERLLVLETIGGLGDRADRLAEAYRLRQQKTAWAAPTPRAGGEGAT